MAADVAWAGAFLSLPAGAAICDAACGPGADIAALQALAPGARVTAFDGHLPFVEAAHAAHPEARVLQGRLIAREEGLPDPPSLGPFDLIWCAGAMYFEGIEACLKHWRSALKPGGTIAFSECCWFTDTPSDAARAMWEEYPAMTNGAGVTEWIAEAGYDILGQKRLSDAAWEAYYTPMDARIAALRPGADPALTDVLEMALEEARIWRAHRDEFGYLLSVVRPR